MPMWIPLDSEQDVPKEYYCSNCKRLVGPARLPRWCPDCGYWMRNGTWNNLKEVKEKDAGEE